MTLYEHCLQKFGSIAKAKRPSEVTQGVIEDFVNDRIRLGAAVATVNRDLRHLQAAVRWAKRRGLIREAPDFHGIFVKEPRRKPMIIPEEDFGAILTALRKTDLLLRHRTAEWWRVFLYLSYYLGLRRGELLGLCWSDVNQKEREVRVSATTSKGRRERTVLMAKELGLILANWKKLAPSDRPEVLHWPFDDYRQLYEDWHRIQTAAGIPDGAHYIPKTADPAALRP